MPLFNFALMIIMSKCVDKQMKIDLLFSDVISLAVDESTDINHITRFFIYVRYGAINSFENHEEFCTLVPLTDTTRGADIFITSYGHLYNVVCVF